MPVTYFLEKYLFGKVILPMDAAEILHVRLHAHIGAQVRHKNCVGEQRCSTTRLIAGLWVLLTTTFLHGAMGMQIIFCQGC